MKKKLWLYIILAVAVSLIAWRFVSAKGKDDKPERRGPQAVAVETGKISVMDLAETASFSGNLKASGKFILAPKVSGQLARLYVNIGDTVRKGQVVAELEDILFRQEYDKALANLDQAASALAEAEKNLDYNRQLLAKSFISQAEFDRVNALYVSELSKHRVALSAKRSAEIQLDNTKVKADWNGAGTTRVIGEKFADEGQLLSVGSPLVSVLDISSLIAEIDVIESDYRKVKPGLPARISSDSWPNEVFQGRVARIAPMLQEQSRQARVELEIANPGLKLKPGMFARVEISFQTKAQVTTVPAAALFKHKAEEGVFLVDKTAMKVSFVPVEQGIRSKDFVEIISPVLEGEVVTLGQDQLDDGSEIILNGTEKKAKPGAKK